MFVAKRYKENPILVPSRDHHWEASATFNISVVKHKKGFYGFYRAISGKDALTTPEQISTIGIAHSRDGFYFDKRRQFISPTEEWEKYGCEDPRATYFEGRYYIFYTAISVFPFAPEGIRTAVAITDDLKNVVEKHRVTTFNSKAMTLFPERVDGKVTLLFSAHTDGASAKMVIAEANEIEEFWDPKYWENWYGKMNENEIENLRRNDFDHVEVGATPIKTKHGWLVIYSHIQNFFPGGPTGPLFGIEALLLDLKDPRKVIGRTRGPMLVPEESYELSGHVANIVFPSGAILEGDILSIYYGAADTTSAVMRVSVDDLISSISADTRARWHFRRAEANPILSPIPGNDWESKGTFNPAAIDLDGKVHLLYRALSEDNTSTMGYASSLDGVHIVERLDKPVYVPREDFEIKKIEWGNSGCEDPRLTKIGKEIYMCYTAFDAIGPPRVAATSIKEADFLARKWDWTKPKLITPANVDDKDACIFPEKVGGKFFIIHRIGNDICGDFLNSLDFDKDTVNKCIRIFGPRHGTWDSLKVGIAGPPIKTPKGWLLLYHAVSEHRHIYRVGAVLLDLKDPTTVLSRTADPIFEPEEIYEREGIVNNVVFPCGMVVRGGLVYIYYGGGDVVTGVATMELDIILGALVISAKY